MRALSTLGASPLHMHARLLELAAGTARCPFAAFLNALQAPRLLFDPAFAPAEGAFLKVAAEACNDGDGDGTAVVEAAMLLGVSFPVGNQGETRAFDCNQRDHNGRTALHRAAEQGCLALLFALLISAGANLNATDNQDDTPLLLACKKGMLEMATMFKDAGAAINVANKGGDTPLLAAVAAGNCRGCCPGIEVTAAATALAACSCAATPRQSAAPSSCSSIFNTRICSAVVRVSARAAATHSPLCPAFHALIWQQQRERVRVGRQSDGEAFSRVCVCRCVRSRASAHVHMQHTQGVVVSTPGSPWSSRRRPCTWRTAAPCTA